MRNLNFRTIMCSFMSNFTTLYYFKMCFVAILEYFTFFGVKFMLLLAFLLLFQFHPCLLESSMNSRRTLPYHFLNLERSLHPFTIWTPSFSFTWFNNYVWFGLVAHIDVQCTVVTGYMMLVSLKCFWWVVKQAMWNNENKKIKS